MGHSEKDVETVKFHAIFPRYQPVRWRASDNDKRKYYTHVSIIWPTCDSLSGILCVGLYFTECVYVLSCFIVFLISYVFCLSV